MTNAQVVMKEKAASAGLTRRQVAQRLGVSVATVRRLEGKRLHPQLRDGVWLFEPDEVEAMARERIEVRPARKARSSAGAVAAEVFR